MLKIKSVELQQIAKTPQQFCYDLPQFVFAGRSNVGKSSLLRTLVNRKKLIRVGSKPGVTQSINFFKVNGELYFVDLPGYGYAKAPKSEQDKWKFLIEKYFREAINIKKVILLLDVRRDPTDVDRLFFEWTQSYHWPLLAVITKTDKVSKNQLFNKKRQIMKEFTLTDDECQLFSALNGAGKEEILKSLEKSLK